MDAVTARYFILRILIPLQTTAGKRICMFRLYNVTVPARKNLEVSTDLKSCFQRFVKSLA